MCSTDWSLIYESGECPDCGDPIPRDMVDGGDCNNCGHVFSVPVIEPGEDVMGTEIQVWELLVAMVYMTPKGLRERSVTCLCVADNIVCAAMDAKRYSEWLLANWYYEKDEEGAFVGCVKVHPKVIGMIDDNGAPTERLGFNSFEWKYDWPGSLDDYIKMREKEFFASGWTGLDREACIESLLNRVDDWDLKELLYHARSSMEDDLRGASDEYLANEYKECFDTEPPTLSPPQTGSSEGSGKESEDANA